MRVVVANNYYYPRGGSERVVFDEEAALKAAGHEVWPFATRDARNLPAATEEYFVAPREIETWGVLDKLRKLPAVFHSGDAARAFGSLLDKYRPHLVHAHNIYGTLTTAVLVEAERRGIPSVMTAHDCKLGCATYLSLDHGTVCEACHGGKFYHCLARNCHPKGRAASAIFTAESYFNRLLRRYELCTRIISPSRFNQEFLIRNGVAASRVAYIPNAIDTDKFEPEWASGEHVLFVGRLSRERGS